MAVLLILLAGLAALPGPRFAAGGEPWEEAHRGKPMDAAEARAFMKRLARHVFEHHVRKTEGSPLRGMVYEYLDVERKGEWDAWVQGEGLDTMHDGAWLAAALATASRVDSDRLYRQFLLRWILPFYLRMLNGSDTLFAAGPDRARPGTAPFDREHAFQAGEKGFVPYWWDDGGSVSLERRRQRNPLGPYPCMDRLADQSNDRFLLSGHSLGSSNHMAQDLAVMLQVSWLLLRERSRETERGVLEETVQAAKNLHECRLRHFGNIPMCVAAAGLAMGDGKLLEKAGSFDRAWRPDNHYYRAFYAYETGKRMPFPGFADDQQYRYYWGIARHGGRLPEALVLATVYDAFTEPLLYRAYSDDAEVPAGINRFDLHPYHARDGRPEDYRSDRKGPEGRPRPVGSRMGPQNMVVCGWALQALQAFPGLWEARHRKEFARDLRVFIDDPPPAARKRERLPWARLEAGALAVEISSSRTVLRVRGECQAAEAVLTVYGRPDAQGGFARIELREGGQATATNHRGERLLVLANFFPGPGGFRFNLQVPYTMVKGQGEWANGVEHGRFSVQIGEEKRNLYLASSEAQVRAWLEHELAGGLRTWEAIFRHKGYIPTGMGAGEEWDRFSDSGGYAHLIAACAQWILVLEGKRDWELHQVPALLPEE